MVVLPSPPEDEAFERFCDLALGGAAVCAIVVSDTPSPRGTNVILRDGSISIPALGLTCSAQGIEHEASEALQLLLDAADEPARPATLFDDLGDGEPAVNGVTATPSGRCSCVFLGEISVVGGHKPLTPKQLGLITYLALHRESSADRIEEAIWPDPMASRRFAGARGPGRRTCPGVHR